MKHSRYVSGIDRLLLQPASHTALLPPSVPCIPQVTGSVNFAGQALLSGALNFSAGGGIDGLSSLAIGKGGLEVEGSFRADSDGIFEGSVTVAGAVMGRGPYMDSSDVRLKTEIEEISGREASAIVRKLR